MLALKGVCDRLLSKTTVLPDRRSSMPHSKSSPSAQSSQTSDDRRWDMVLGPRDYFLGPVFAATKQSGPREVTIGERRYLIGGFHPMRRNFCPPALDVRHARAIFCLLSFRDPFDGTRLIRFSFNEFCRRYACSNGGRYAQAISEIVADLLDSYIRVTDIKTSVSHQYRLIEHIDIETRPIRRKDAGLANSPQVEMWFNGCTLSPEFYGMLGRVAELQHLNLGVFTGIRSPLAQAIYLYLPSRAFHHSERKPFEISITKLLQQVSFPVPPLKFRRRQMFVQNNNPILKQLNGVEILSGRFRVALADAADGSDWKLQAWVEKQPQRQKLSQSKSKLINAYLQSGRSRQYLEQALHNIQPLSAYELELLERAEVEVAGNDRFFELAKAVLKPSRFVGLLSEAKGDALEGRTARKSPTARLIYRIMEAVSTPA